MVNAILLSWAATFQRLSAIDEQGHEVTRQFFKIDNQQLQIRRNTMPSMLTLDERVIRQDCLCYLMERIRLACLFHDSATQP
jgi:hypothetical protein